LARRKAPHFLARKGREARAEGAESPGRVGRSTPWLACTTGAIPKRSDGRRAADNVAPTFGGVAQLVERLTGSQEVRGFESLRLHSKMRVRALAGVVGNGHRLALLTALSTNVESESAYPGSYPSLAMRTGHQSSWWTPDQGDTGTNGLKGLVGVADIARTGYRLVRAQLILGVHDRSQHFSYSGSLGKPEHVIKTGIGVIDCVIA
jgi:hypothetical protein